MAETTTRARRDSGDLSALLLPELRKIATNLGIEGASDMKKPDLVTAITDLQAANREAAKAEREARRAARHLAAHGIIQGDFLQLLCRSALRPGVHCLCAGVDRGRDCAAGHRQRCTELTAWKDLGHRDAADAAVGDSDDRDVLLFLSYLSASF